MDKAIALNGVDLLIRAWELYRAETQVLGVEAMLSITRAWRLLKFIESEMLCLTACSRCAGKFVTHRHDWAHNARRRAAGGRLSYVARCGG